MGSMLLSAAPRRTPDGSEIVDALPAIGLDELNERAALQDRIDVKYIVALTQLATLVERLSPAYRALEIDGRRAFRYRTTYYDTPDMLLVREHVQQRRRRFKCRKRRYLDSERSIFEVKLKGARGRTIKHAMACGADDALQPDEALFLRGLLREAYGRELREGLEPVLVATCRRMTIAAPELGERLTCDVGLGFGGGRLDERFAIVESKSPRGAAAADRALLAMGVRPVNGCSKYLLGMALTREGVRDNNLRPLLRRYFTPANALGAAAAGDPARSMTCTSTRVTSRT
jgi:VTC domain